MKWFAFVLACYVLLLSGIPCKADDDCCMDEITQSAIHPKEKKKETGHKPVSPCSPFFACGACHGAVVPQFTLTIAPVVPLMATYPSSYTEQLSPDFSMVIWQPPKFCL